MGWRLQFHVRESMRPRGVVRGLLLNGSCHHITSRLLTSARASRLRVCLSPLRPLQPVVGDWQQRVKHAKRQQRVDAAAAAAAVSGAEPAAAQATAAGAGSAAAAAAAGASRAGKPDLDALSEGLPSGWRAMWDATHARMYYGNIDTQASTGGRACGAAAAPPGLSHAASLTGREVGQGLQRCQAAAAVHRWHTSPARLLNRGRAVAPATAQPALPAGAPA